MKQVWDSAVGLLLITGGLLGATFPLGKVATAAGVAPIVWSFLISCGAGGILAVAMLMRGAAFRLDRHKLRYYLIAGCISYALPNMLLFTAIPHLGAGFTGIMFTLSPVITLVLSLIFRMRRPNLLGMAGIATGFFGALVVATTRGEAGQAADYIWIGMGLTIPLVLALGNIYRTIDWPQNAGPIELAVGSHLAAAAMLALVGVAAPAFRFDLAPLLDVPLPVLAQVASSAAMFAFFFRLQAVGGPVYLSQIGYVAAAIGLVSGTLFLDERYAVLTWLGALVIFAGVMMTTRAQRAKG
ncbi:DMT family transporter [Mesorhizobium xinjiangense]|uniref:DMT family transporter n=1 Tax=Mesorhizobium xinjiangense TaxID=2678685 RepID=UPI0012EED6BE|nr:DMT family transporter [Mesorhizobium xinjiangense]